MSKFTIKIHRFKDTGKFYDDFDQEVEIEDGSLDPTSAILDELRTLCRASEFFWLVTGEGMPYEVPRLLI